jgi:Asp-tRNA(Asn)/Glu-tRNA(Gln) amidotransferase A subunit family amidase
MTRPIPAPANRCPASSPHSTNCRRICASAFRAHFFSTTSIPRSPTRSKKRSGSLPIFTPRFATEAYAYHKSLGERSPELYQPATLARIQSGADITAEEALRASRELQASRHDIQEIFDKVDVLLTPTVPIPPPSLADLRARPDDLRAQEIIMLRNTRPFNVWGIPTISIPCGFTKSGLPIGLQLAAAPWRGIVLLQAAHAYEQATAWHKQRPEMAQSN